MKSAYQTKAKENSLRCRAFVPAAARAPAPLHPINSNTCPYSPSVPAPAAYPAAQMPSPLPEWPPAVARGHPGTPPGGMRQGEAVMWR